MRNLRNIKRKGIIVRVWLNKNVKDATYDRVSFLFDEFENVVVWISGGKDSTVLFDIAYNIAKEKNKLPLKVCWIDQEAEWKLTEEWIKKIMYMKDIEPYWIQIPMKLSNATCTRKDFLECWNEDEKELWVRDKDPIAITENRYGTDRFHELFSAISNVEWGDKKTCSLSGVRAEESPGRWTGLTVSETYRGITWGRKNELNKNHFTFYPLYDWSYSDIWKYIHDNNCYYNKIYDYFYIYGLPVQNMRVSNLHHETAVRSLFYMQEIEPETHNKLCKRLEGIHSATHLGFDDYFVNELPFMFKSWKEYRDYLLDKLIIPAHQKNFKNRFKSHDLEFDDEPYYKRILKGHINAILANDWDEGVKIKNIHRRYSTPTTRKNRKEKEALLSKEK